MRSRLPECWSRCVGAIQGRRGGRGARLGDGVSAGRVGSLRVMRAHAAGRSCRRLAPLAGVALAAVVFTALLILVRLRWRPLETADHSSARDINALVAGDTPLVTVVKAVTWLG